MTEDDELRRYADECRHIAAACKDEAEKKSWLRFAETFLRRIPRPADLFPKEKY
jgi:hypothetical protein